MIPKISPNIQMKKLLRYLFSGLLLLSSVSNFACGPYDTMTHNPLIFHFYQGDNNPVLAEEQRTENLRLWQTLTSSDIPKEDIENAVYTSTLANLKTMFDDENCQNKFIGWLSSNNSTKLKDFLLIAKEVEELRADRVSAWYYPSDKSGFDALKDEKKKFDTILATCKQHKRGFLVDRYSLQAIRILISIGKYQECIDYYDSTLKSYPDHNLFKRMAKGYIAGSLYRLGETDKAYKLFAECGDFNSIIWDNVDSERFMKILAWNNPESDVLKSRLNGFIGYGDDKDNRKYLAIADAALSSPFVKHRGDWLYLKAYIESVFDNNSARALNFIRQANSSSFSVPQMENDAKFFEICIRAQRGDVSSWQKDSKWILESYGNADGIWFYIIPSLLKKGMTSEALLLANYGAACNENRKDKNGNRGDVYANIGFQILLSVKASDVIKYQKMLNSRSSGIIGSFIQKVRKDDDYLNDIIGTLCLREGRYDLAEKYFSKVSGKYQESMNIYDYLIYDPWTYCYTPADKWHYDSYKSDYEFADESGHNLRPNIDKRKAKRLPSSKNAKLNFAKEMSKLQKLMTSSNTSDERMLAKLKYTIGRYNSFNTCWALTQYWVGNANQRNYQPFYWLWSGSCQELEYLVDAPTQLIGMDSKFEQDILSIFNTLKSPAALSEANMMLRNYRTIARYYPESEEGKYLATHCDGWKDWI